jgi:hypothetical protein
MRTVSLKSEAASRSIGTLRIRDGAYDHGLAGRSGHRQDHAQSGRSSVDRSPERGPQRHRQATVGGRRRAHRASRRSPCRRGNTCVRARTCAVRAGLSVRRKRQQNIKLRGLVATFAVLAEAQGFSNGVARARGGEGEAKHRIKSLAAFRKAEWVKEVVAEQVGKLEGGR